MNDADSIQHRDTHRGVFFENGAPVPVAAPESAPISRREQLVDSLLEGDVPLERAERLAQQILEKHRQWNIEDLAEAFAAILAKLGNGAEGVALRRAIRGGEGETIREASARLKVSHVALFKREKRIRKRLGLTRDALVEGTMPEEQNA